VSLCAEVAAISNKKEAAMFNVDNFVKACQGQSPGAVKELLAEALRDPEGIKEALAAIGGGKNVSESAMGDMAIYRSPELTILKAAVPARFKSPPHNHLMWAVIGVYDGQENNYFYRRSGESLEAAGGRELQPPDVLVLGTDAIHAIENPLDRTSFAIHVYGGDLPAAPRRMWNPFTLQEEPFEYQSMMRYARQLLEK
jgi:predicted metal-dependent enzyme (double-stranded beta helix superfamily)